MKTLSILLVFFQLKWWELKDFLRSHIHKEVFIGIGAIFLYICLVILFSIGMETDAFWMQVPAFVIWSCLGLILLYGIYLGLEKLTKWLIKLCRNNWQKATKIVNNRLNHENGK